MFLDSHARHARRTTNLAAQARAAAGAGAIAPARPKVKVKAKVKTFGVASLSLIVVALALTGATPEVASGAGDPRVWTVDTKANGRHVAKKVADPDNFTGRIYTAKSEANERALILNKTDDADASATDASTAVGSIQLSVNRADTAVDSMEAVQLGDDQLALSQKIANLSSQIATKAQLASDAFSWSQTYYSDAQVAEQEAAAAAAAAQAAADAHAADPDAVDPDEVKALEKEAKSAAKTARVLDKKSNKQANKAEKHTDKRARLITKLDDLLAEHGESRNGGNGNGGGDDFIVLQPGTGFGGPTGQPGPVGSPDDPGYDAKAIARWDVVPYQTFDDDFHIGVVAFHMNGIDRVEFSVEGGPWTAVTDMQLNPRTNVWEYTAVLDPDLFEDGPIEVRAIAWPIVGEPRVLGGEIATGLDNGEHSLFAFVDADGSSQYIRWVDSVNGSDTTGDGSESAPFESIHKALRDVADTNGSASGALVYLKEGTHAWDRTAGGTLIYDRWATITAAPGLEPTDVVITGGAGLKSSFLRVTRVSFERNFYFSSASGFDRYLWVEDCKLVGEHSSSATQAYRASNWTGVFLTDVELEDYSNGAQGAMLARRVSVSNLQSDAFGDTRFLVNCTADGIDAGGTSFHPDVYQFSGRDQSRDNTIVYGLLARNTNCQGIFADDLARIDNTAFVNVLIEATLDTGAKSQWKDVSSNHLLLWHVANLNQPISWRSTDLVNVSVRGSVWEKIEGSISFDTSFSSHNHFIDIDSYGALMIGDDSSDGDPQFIDLLNGDFRLGPTSPLRNRVQKVLAPAGLNGLVRQAPVSIGVYAD